MLVSGGGASNGFLIGLLKDAVPCEVIIPSAQIIAYKEALIFAFLGVLRWRQETNISAKITGADHDSCSGAIYLA
jgi:anhydro-N-acetylmuramic acid kinase